SAWMLKAAAIDDECRAFDDTGVDVFLDALSMRTGHQWAHFRCWVHAGANLQCPHPGCKTRDEFITYRVRYGDYNRNRHAALAGGSICRAHQCCDRLLQIRIRHNDHVILGPAKCLDAFPMGTTSRVDMAR